MLLKIIGVLVALVIVFGLWVRVSPLPQDRLSAKPGPDAEGVHPSIGGIKVVRPLSDLPENALDRMVEIAAATPRTERIGDGTDPATFVTRSKLWAFPDIAVIWVEDGNLHVQSHLVFGKGDMGVNAAKVTRWFDRLEAEA
ncbi:MULTISPECIES: DUF1499 domain-containing protein [Maritimibacter]|uniref:DUF1499 domain-containing protein n=1 Tax=Maritimibacter alkaliphilus HTCC2654 TaxID=314271 RepID=A3VJP6_9RHOB|nr:MULTISPECIES: DUF1499 domain-containing protein [Maritimibacter]EAQ11623.1 hypothetical protein RB2654_04309 [Rhodobacterales bacterium HTCC2654] [Maritimibacter alkaliphilus HTCC2654]MBL6429518.1 DUF1499 domain-containing protein [Maritimibacter sp.]TYP81440.1 uncharacterized protein DUF1499 [Maritimibacter alkaliphilus HTCC2654]